MCTPTHTRYLAGSTLIIDAPRPGLLTPPAGAVHRTLPPLLTVEAAADGSGGYKLRHRTSGSGRRDKRQSLGRRRAISEFSVSGLVCKYKYIYARPLTHIYIIYYTLHIL